MTVTINLVYIIAVWLYALIVTGFWVCALIGGGKDREDGIMVQAAMDTSIRQFREIAASLEEQNGKLRTVIEVQKSGKLTLEQQYIKIQNEYAWYRMLVRNTDPEAHESACVSMYKQKKKQMEGNDGDKRLDSSLRWNDERGGNDGGSGNDGGLEMGGSNG